MGSKVNYNYDNIVIELFDDLTYTLVRITEMLMLYITLPMVFRIQQDHFMALGYLMVRSR